MTSIAKTTTRNYSKNELADGADTCKAMASYCAGKNYESDNAGNYAAARTWRERAYNNSVAADALRKASRNRK